MEVFWILLYPLKGLAFCPIYLGSLKCEKADFFHILCKQKNILWKSLSVLETTAPEFLLGRSNKIGLFQAETFFSFDFSVLCQYRKIEALAKIKTFYPLTFFDSRSFQCEKPYYLVKFGRFCTFFFTFFWLSSSL